MEFYFTKKKNNNNIIFVFYTYLFVYSHTLYCYNNFGLQKSIYIWFLFLHFSYSFNFQHLFVFFFEKFYFGIPIQETEVSYLLLFPLFLFLERCLANKSLKSSFNKLLGVAFLWPKPNLSLPPRPLILPPSSDIASNGILIPVEFKPRASPKKCIQNRRTHWANVSW